MSASIRIEEISKATEAIIGAPFVWCFVPGGSVFLEDASNYEKNPGSICRTAWGQGGGDAHGYVYRAARGGAWNIVNPAYLQATDRVGLAPRGRLNDAGFRCAYYFEKDEA